MKTKILDFLVRTQKATAALLAAAGAVAAATWVPEPWNGYAATAGVILAWVLTYVFPFVEKAVEAFPSDEIDLSEIDLTDWERELLEPEPADDLGPRSEVLEGEVLDPFPDTVEIPAIRIEDTAGIPLIEHDEPEPVLTEVAFPDGGTEWVPQTVDEILDRLEAEGVRVR